MAAETTDPIRRSDDPSEAGPPDSDPLAVAAMVATLIERSAAGGAAEDQPLSSLSRQLVDLLLAAGLDAVVTTLEGDAGEAGLPDAPARLLAALTDDADLVGALTRTMDATRQTTSSAAARLHQVRAEVLTQIGRPAAGLAAAEAVIRTEPSESTAVAAALYWSAVALRALDRPDEALTRLGRVEAHPATDTGDRLLVAEQYLELDARDAAAAAVAAAEQARDTAEPSADERVRQAALLAALGDPAGALTELEPVIAAENPPDADVVAAHQLAAALLLEASDPPEEARVVALLERLEDRLGTFADQPALRMWMGTALVRAGQHARALHHLDERLDDELRDRPPDRRALTQLFRGVALIETEAFVEAEAVLRDAAGRLDRLGLSPVAAEALLGLGMVLVPLGRPGEATEALTRAEEAAGDDAPALLRGRIALWRGIARTDDPGAARDALERAATLLPPEGPERDLLALRLGALLQTEAPERSVALLDGLVERHPEWAPGVTFARSTAEAALGRHDDAAATLEAAITDPTMLTDEQRFQARLLRADILVRGGRAADAVAALDGIDDATLPTATATALLRVRWNAALATNDRPLLLATMRQAGEHDPAVAPLAALARAEEQLSGDLGALFATYRSLEQPADPDNPLAWLVAAQARQLAERDDVEDALQRAIELEPSLASNPFTALTRAMGASRRGDLAAIDAYGELAATPDQRALHRSLRANALEAIGRLREAVEAFEQAERLSAETPSGLGVTLHAQALATRSMLLLRLDDVDGAERAVATALEVVEALPATAMATHVVHLAHGALLMRLGEHEAADEALSRSTLPDGAPVNLHFVVDYLRGVNWSLAGADHAEDALRWLTAAVERRPDDVDALRTLGETHLVLDDPSTAIDLFERALADATDKGVTTSILRDLADAQRRLGVGEVAVGTARRAAAIEPDDARNWLALGASQLELGRHDAAAIAFRRGWRSGRPRPSDPVATKLLLGLSKALLEQEDRAQEALDALSGSRAARLASAEPLIELNRAVALLRCDRVDEAVTSLRRAGRPEEAARVATAGADRGSWLGFWFGAGVSHGRAVTGGGLLALACVALAAAVVDPAQVSWLGWIADGNVRPLAPLVVALLLFLLPVMTRIKVGDIELEQPTPAAPDARELQAVSWDAVERKVRSVLAAPMSVRSADALPGGQPVGPDVVGAVDITAGLVTTAATGTPPPPALTTAGATAPEPVDRAEAPQGTAQD